jgi:predicted membrane protein
MSEQHRYGSHFWLAVVLIGVGVLLLLDNLGFDFIGSIWRFWPVVLIVIGLFKLKTGDPSERSSGYTLLTIGGIFLLISLRILRWHTIWQFWPVALIIAGLSLIYRRHRAADQVETEGYNEETIDAVAVFGGCERKICSTNFRYAHASAVFGGVVLDFSNAKLTGDATVNIFTMFGGTELKVPQNWQVVMKGVPIFGGFEDSRAQPAEGYPENRPVLIVRGFVMFGGIEIKNP